ncbi:hypothetical protein GCM10025875_17230 [Litorihabitans aurantiacus]|uniref:Uncharacterized protein n=1 Tax=Litorihabitans aurantiacus TaxID=1930061 RepID=A0AA37XEF8_9MICO|nr:hypothetical protein GCM10025875_17230 [Litorihabitans aurantiacus]
MHGGEPLPEAREPLAGEREGRRIAVDADDAGVRALLEHGLGVAAHAERAVHEDAPGLDQGRCEEVDAALQQHGDVEVPGAAVAVLRHRSSS